MLGQEWAVNYIRGWSAIPAVIQILECCHGRPVRRVETRLPQHQTTPIPIPFTVILCAWHRPKSSEAAILTITIVSVDQWVRSLVRSDCGRALSPGFLRGSKEANHGMARRPLWNLRARHANCLASPACLQGREPISLRENRSAESSQTVSTLKLRHVHPRLQQAKAKPLRFVPAQNCKIARGCLHQVQEHSYSAPSHQVR